MFENIVDSLKELHRDTASFSELTENRKRMDETIENITSPLLIMVMGEFSTGKSSFINALVEKEVTIVNARPTTAVITKLCYGLEDRITVFFQDGTQKNYSVEDFEALTVESEETIELRKNIDFVERALPLEMLKSMTIIDSPGLNSLNQSHEETTRRFMDKSDTVIWLFDAHDPCKQTEIDAMKRLNPRLSPLVLVNKMDLLDEDDGDSPEKILSDIGRKLRNNRLEVQDIIGISAKMAFQGKQKNNEKILSESNIGEFYNRLETVILPNREEYKRNAMFDNLAQVMFEVGTVLADKKSDNDKQKDTDYAAYIEAEEALALSTDALENVLEDFLGFFGLSGSRFSSEQVNRMKLNAAERTVFGVLYWLGMVAEKNTEAAQKYLEGAAVRNDAVAQRIFAEICERLGQEDKAKYWWDRLGIKKSAVKTEKNTKRKNNSSNAEITSQNSSSTVGYGLDLIRVTDNNSSAEEMYNKGRSYENEYNYAEALKWYRKAADAGNVLAMNSIGWLYRNGQGVQTNYDEALKWFQKAVNAGYYNANESIKAVEHIISKKQRKTAQAILSTPNLSAEEMYNKGFSYEKQQNYAEAMNWYRKAADAGNIVAMGNIGWLYQKGYGVTQDYTEAMKWYQKAADDGNTTAMFFIGHFYQNGYGVTQDYEKSMKWYRKAADAGNTNARQKLSELQNRINKQQPTTPVPSTLSAEETYNKGCYYEEQQNYAEAMKWYRKAADVGNAEAMYSLGRIYQASQDSKSAIKWYHKAADAGNTNARQKLSELQNRINKQQPTTPVPSTLSAEETYNKGCYYEEQQNYAEAMKWYKKAAETKDARAMCSLGRIYQLSNDTKSSMKWYRKAADAGNDYAKQKVAELQNRINKQQPTPQSTTSSTANLSAEEIYNNGLYYEKLQNYAEAMKWYQKAADAGNASAMNNIGWLYEEGNGVTQDYPEAMKWFRKAADAGNIAAMHGIGWLYEKGNGVPQDYTEAKKWYRKAALRRLS